MTPIKSFQFRVEPEHIDFQKNISPMIMADMIVKTAGEDAKEKGFGLMDLHKKNYTWVISRFVMELDIIPTVDDILSIETWVRDVGNVFTTRDFRISNSENKLLGHAVLSWAILDLDTRRSVPLSAVPELNDYIVDEDHPLVTPERLPDIEGEVSNSFEVRYSDVDLNVHTNTLKYLQCVFDCFSLDFYAKRILKRVEVNFLRELVYGDKGSVYIEEVEENNFLFKLVTTEGVVVSRSRMVFEWKE